MIVFLLAFTDHAAVVLPSGEFVTQQSGKESVCTNELVRPANSRM